MKNFQKQENTSMEGALESGPSGSGFFGGVVRQAGVRWSTQILSWVSTIVVARLLTSEDYGLVAMAIVYLNVASMIAEFGLGATIVAKQELSDQTINQLHGVSTIISGLIYSLTFLLAPVLATFFGEPRLLAVVRVMALGPLLNGVAAVPLARARRDMNYRLVSRVELLGAVTTTLSVLSLALWGARFWALVVGNVVGNGMVMLAIVRSSPVRLASPVLSQLKGSLQYARHVMTQQLAQYAYVSSDAIVIGRFLGAAPLGIYRFAAQITSLPSEKLVNVVGSVTLPYFARLSTDRAEMRLFFLSITEVIATGAVPILVGFALVAGDLVPVVFGATWVPSIPLIQITAIGSIAQVLSVLLAQVLTSTMQAQAASRYTLLALGVLPAAYVAGAMLAPSVLTIAVIWTIAQPLVSALMLRRVLQTLDLRFSTYFGALVPAFIGAAIMVPTVLATHRLVPPGTAPLMRLAATITVGALVYGLFHFVAFGTRNRQLLQRLRAH